MNRFIVLFSILFLGVACSEAQESKENKSSQSSTVINEVVDAKKFQEIRTGSKVVLIDVRTADEFNEGHIAGALNIDYFSDDFKERINKFNKNVTTLIYCASGGRSGKTAKLMKEQGFEIVYDLEGGYRAWPYK